MMLTKNVNGREVKLTAAEERALKAEWAKADNEAKAAPPQMTPEEELADLRKRIETLERGR